MASLVLMTALKNRIKKNGKGDYDFNLSNININGVKRGCSGYITNKDNGITIYVDTEPSAYGPLEDKILWRIAEKVDGRYVSGYNKWGMRKNDSYIKDIVNVLDNSDCPYVLRFKHNLSKKN